MQRSPKINGSMYGNDSFASYTAMLDGCAPRTPHVPCVYIKIDAVCVKCYCSTHCIQSQSRPFGHLVSKCRGCSIDDYIHWQGEVYRCEYTRHLLEIKTAKLKSNIENRLFGNDKCALFGARKLEKLMMNSFRLDSAIVIEARFD